MSYILEALRKSDQQRQRGAAPTLLAVQTTEVAPKQPTLLAYGLLAAVLVGAGVVIGWLRPWQTEQAAPEPPKSFAAKPLESTPREPEPAPSAAAPQTSAPELQTTQAEPAPSEMAPQAKLQGKLKTATRPVEAASASSEKTPRPKGNLPVRAKPETDGPPREADAAAPGRAAAPAPERPVDLAAANAAGEQAVISMAELPPQIREALPAMTISVHGYSDNPAGRLVGINSRILREGDSVVPGLELQQITPDGMIFSYKGYRFRRGVK
jgi:general secretion pathway protein B